uniref:Uncharacterized protein n=1 Tax=Rhizophora mucronata TaxID=61149 RepID=A0A2P2NLM8_RHIMU
MLMEHFLYACIVVFFAICKPKTLGLQTLLSIYTNFCLPHLILLLFFPRTMNDKYHIMLHSSLYS